MTINYNFSDFAILSDFQFNCAENKKFSVQKKQSPNYMEYLFVFKFKMLLFDILFLNPLSAFLFFIIIYFLKMYVFIFYLSFLM